MRGLMMATTIALGAMMMAVSSPADADPTIAIPHDNDNYSRLVARAEADDPGVDFRALRFAWLDSAARKRAKPIGELSRAMSEAIHHGDNAATRATAGQILSIDYTDMLAHKFRRQSCHMLGDTACEQHEHFVEFGLLNSIVRGKDGRTPATAWEVASIAEEYFILSMIAFDFKSQALVNIDGRAYDAFDAKDPGATPPRLLFDITVMLPKEVPGLK